MTKLLEHSTLMAVLLGVILLIVSILLLNNLFQSTMDDVDWREEIYRVERGDSLWALSGKYCPDTVDRREWIEEIQALNDLPSSTIQAGQKIIVLAVKEATHD